MRAVALGLHWRAERPERRRSPVLRSHAPCSSVELAISAGPAAWDAPSVLDPDAEGGRERGGELLHLTRRQGRTAE